jgi:hypothetical protein
VVKAYTFLEIPAERQSSIKIMLVGHGGAAILVLGRIKQEIKN